MDQDTNKNWSISMGAKGLEKKTNREGKGGSVVHLRKSKGRKLG